MNPGRIPNVTILDGTNNISRGSDEEEALWESMIYYPLAKVQLRGSDRLHCANEHEDIDCSREKAQRRNNQVEHILRNLGSQNAGRMILMDIEHELRVMDQARLTTDGIHFDSIEGQAWLNRAYQERLDKLEVELFDTGVLKEEEASKEPTITTFVPPNLETRLGAVPAVTIYKSQSSSETGHRTDVRDRLGEAPMRRTINPRRKLGPVNSTAEATSTSKSDTRSETTSTSREGPPFNNTMVPVNARPLQDVKLNHYEGNREEGPGRFLTTRTPIGQHVKMFKQLKTPPGHMKERV